MGILLLNTETNIYAISIVNTSISSILHNVQLQTKNEMFIV